MPVKQEKPLDDEPSDEESQTTETRTTLSAAAYMQIGHLAGPEWPAAGDATINGSYLGETEDYAGGPPGF